ncbi:MAG: BTAD domain-containing putative transcriptional regulator [Pseudomonadota bacterium]
MEHISKNVLISLTGTPAIRLGGVRQRLSLSKQTQILLFMLSAYANRGVRRERIAEHLWPDTADQRANSALNTAVWRVKRAIACYDGLEIQTFDGLIKLNISAPSAIDSHQLEEAVMADEGQISTNSNIGNSEAKITKALEVCRGPFMEGFSSDWILPLRERYHEIWVQALRRLMGFASSRADYTKALIWGREILNADPFRENIQQDVMRLYALNGQRAKAILQYKGLRELLRRELGIEPLPETVALANRLCGVKPFDNHTFQVRTEPIGPALRTTP